MSVDAKSGRGSPFRAMLAVFWAFCGIRKSAERDVDLASIKPSHIVVAGIIGGALFVLTVLTVVRLVLR